MIRSTWWPANRALDQGRRAEVKTKPDLRGSRWALLKDARHWSGAQLNMMHWLQRSGLKTARAWRLKEALRSVYETGHSAQQAGHLIQAAKARAKGYATDQALIAISYQLCARLKHLSRNPWLAHETT
ncbi:MAG: hypothetical protein DI635_12600 [Pseudoxanthomonas suwonensis]|nr:MAG: hypothetical protein DI635_12600 [Pseudoxanthomonas suwonensis]